MTHLPSTARRPIAVLVNPHARRNREDSGLSDRLRRALGSAGFVGEAGDPESLDAFAARCRGEAVEILAVAGGDGTGSVALTHFRRAYGAAPLPRFAPLRGGTMNTISNGAGVPRRRAEQLLARLVRAHETGSVRGRHFGTISVHPSGADERLCCLFGVGLGYSFLAEYYGRGRPHPTPITAMETLGALVGSAVLRTPLIQRVAGRHPCDVVLDGEALNEDAYLMVLAGTVPQIGLGFTPFHSMRDHHDGGFHVVAMHSGALGAVASLPGTWFGRPLRPSRAREQLTQRARLSAPSGSLGYFLDGDIALCDGPIELEAGPQIEIVWG